MENREMQLAHKIREACGRIRLDGSALRQDLLELIENIDRFLECVACNSSDAGQKHYTA